MGRRRFIGRKRFFEPNTFIGGAGAQMTTASAFAFIMGISESIIKNYLVDANGNISCYISQSYAFRADAFNNLATGNVGNWYITYGDISSVTYYIDIDGKANSFEDQSFLFQSNFKYGYFPNNGLLISSNQSFRLNKNTGYLLIYLGKIGGDYIGSSSFNNGNFTQIPYTNTEIFVPEFFETNNSGGVDADLSGEVIPNGGDVVFIGSTDYETQLPPTGLIVSSITTTTATISFTPPVSTNGILKYEVWVNGAFHDWITSSGDTIIGLESGTINLVKLKCADIYYNLSVFSNEITITTL